MTTTYTPSLRFVQPSVNDVATENTWGGLLNTDMALIESAITGTVTIDLTGLTTYTLTANNGSSDQSRPHGIVFTGPLGGSPALCTVTIPSVVRFGRVFNNSTGSVVLATGGGTSLTVPFGAQGWTWYYCDGTNVVVPGAGSQSQGAMMWATAVNVTWVAPAGCIATRWRVRGPGGPGGAGSGGPGGGGGGGGFIDSFWPSVTPGTAFLLNAGAGVSSTVGQGSFAMGSATGTAGGTGTLGSPGSGGAGGGTLFVVPGSATTVAYSGAPGQAGFVISAAAWATGNGGAAGDGGAAGPMLVGPPVSGPSAPNVTNVGGGAAGQLAGAAATGGGPEIEVEWWCG